MQKKSNLWLIIIAIVVLIALLWPILRRNKTTTDLTSDNEELATTSDKGTDLEGAPVDSIDLSGTSSSETQLSPLVPGSVSVTATPATITTPPANLALKVFFGNQVRNPKTWQCRTVASVMRTIPNTKAVARGALRELLQGPSRVDSTTGFFTSINPGVTIKELMINNGIARVDFSQALVSGVETPCLKDGIRAQITQTLKQFPTVRSVIISVNGTLF